MGINTFTGDRAYRSTEPFDANDPPRFGQLIETTKDAIASELSHFFSYASQDMRAKIKEVPTIEKFAHGGVGSTLKSMETVVDLIMSYGDTPDKFPMIAITSANVREKVLGIGTNQVNMGQAAARILTTRPAPYNIPPGSTLQVRTWPKGLSADPVDTTILFSEILFPDMTQITEADLVKAINAQVLYSTAILGGGGLVAITSGGPAATSDNNGVSVVGGSPEVLDQLGLAVCEGDTTQEHTSGVQSPYKRYAVAGDMTINLDVISDDLNTRTALADLVYDFFTFYLSDRMYQLQGRSYLDPSQDPPEWFQLVFERKFTWSGEYSTPRQGGEQEAHVYSVRGSVPLMAFDYINRYLNRGDATYMRTADCEDESGVQGTEELPPGDYPGSNYLDR